MSNGTDRKFLYGLVASSSNGCWLHRMILPWRYLEADFPELDVDLSGIAPVGRFRWYQTHGHPKPPTAPLVGEWKGLGGRWLWSIDDDYMRLPDFNGIKLTDEELGMHYLCLDAADAILVSTPFLAEQMKRPGKTLVAPNLLEVDSYGVTTPSPVTEAPLRVMWAGSKTHGGDLAVVEDAIDAILKKWGPKKVEFVFFGMPPPPKLLKRYVHRGVHHEDGVHFGAYAQVLKQIRPHVVLAPLADVVFNYSKSNIRVIEGWSLAAAVVTSPIGEYAVVRDGEDGLHATTTEDWFAAIDKLIADREYREHLATNGRRRAEDFNWASHAAREPWRRAIRQLSDWSK